MGQDKGSLVSGGKKMNYKKKPQNPPPSDAKVITHHLSPADQCLASL